MSKLTEEINRVSPAWHAAFQRQFDREAVARLAIGQREHGTNSAYRGGCRCTPCAEAHREYDTAYRRIYRLRKKSGGARNVKENGR